MKTPGQKPALVSRRVQDLGFRLFYYYGLDNYLYLFWGLLVMIRVSYAPKPYSNG